MTTPFADRQQFPEMMRRVCETAQKFLNHIGERAPGLMHYEAPMPETLGWQGQGGPETLQKFLDRYLEGMSGSAGPRNFSFVTGGTTPAALIADWLISVFDQNSSHFGHSAAPWVEQEALGFLRDLLRLPEALHGLFVTGATMSNFVGLAVGRQWIAQQQGIELNEEGLYGMKPIDVFSGTPHSSALKSLSMLGMGRKSWRPLRLLPDRESIDVRDLEEKLAARQGEPCLVLASAGTVNTGDFDELAAIAALKEKFPFYLHVDAAFGGFVACSSHQQHLIRGLEHADSVTIDLHKWLNVPYDSGVIFCRHRSLQTQVFQNNAAYLKAPVNGPLSFADLGPENSRRFRGLTTWFTLTAYGAEGYREIVDRNLRLAQEFGAKLQAEAGFVLLSPVHSNIVCFGLQEADKVPAFLESLKQSTEVFMTPSVYQGQAAVRAAFVNWSTTDADIQRAFDACRQSLRAILKA